LVKKLLHKIAFEIRMHIMDARWRSQWFHCWEAYPPSFYYRYTAEEREAIWQRDKKELERLIEEFKLSHDFETQKS